MTFKDLNPKIQSWIDSDEFTNVVVLIATKFDLPSTEPIIDTIFNLILGNISSENFKTQLLSSLPEEKRDEKIIIQLVKDLLIPIQDVLLESNIYISKIISSPYKHQSNKLFISDNLSDPKHNSQSTPITTSLEVDNITSSPIINTNKEENAPFITLNNKEERAFKDTNQTTSSPFIMHSIKPIENNVIANKDIDIIRPMFYTEPIVQEEGASIANIEFGNIKNTKEIHPDNIINLKDLPL